MKRGWGRDNRYATYNSGPDHYDYYQGRNRPFIIKRLIQFAAAGLLFLAILGLSTINHPTCEALRSKAAYFLTDDRSNILPAVERFVTSGIWSDTFDKGLLQVFGNIGVPVNENVKPVTIPVSGSIIRAYGWESSDSNEKLLHPGIDIASTQPSAPVHAALKGNVRYIGKNRRLGNYVELDHGDGMVTVYGNCGEIIVVEGQQVQEGEIIASLQNVSRPYLHFEIRVNGKAVDPLNSMSGLDTDA